MKALLVVLLLLLGVAFVADRVVERWAEGYVADQLVEQAGLAAAPEVDARGFPFLTQAVAGRYEDVRISLSAEELRQPEGTRADVVLRGVQVPLSSVVSGSVQEVPVDRIDGTATLSYALLSEQLGRDTELTRDGDGLRITRTVEVLGQEVRLSAVGQVRLDGGALVADVREASGAGVEVPGFVLDRAVDLLDLRHPVPALPFGLELTGVRPAEDGVVIEVEATDTVLRAPE
ncbi:LmeA family phospholipid-binding protein [Blastococcus sp. PRF04-17]|uniref:LmeA family phospholipid-binding protein n=1 Tax=Blastococcus sp. PRF04-17 TaxID=2933797 RepID=UPI001FF10C71|nr:DUF2993 domain-containing protein [Blastococcus sp. PRF04-17]UOY00915.1 DUF2993 domain-containing protein [Blastococcus sp. PRF04-17]